MVGPLQELKPGLDICLQGLSRAFRADLGEDVKSSSAAAPRGRSVASKLSRGHRHPQVVV